MTYSFNLLERPWIPCLSRDGTTESVSLRDILVRSHEFVGITHESPLVGVSVMRLLLAVLHRVYGPRDEAAWMALWRAPAFETAPLDRYLSQCRGRFDLFSDTRPFFQDGGIPEELAVPVSRLLHAAASGNNPTLFDHSMDDGCAAIAAEEAALQIVTHQAFAVGGLVTPDSAIPNTKSADGSPGVKGALCSVRGDDLHHSLLLNLRRYDPAVGIPFGSSQDLPSWEREESARVCERGPSGWLDLLTWQSRRIRLLPSGDPKTPVVPKVAVLKGETVTDNFDPHGKDSMLAWQLLEKTIKGRSPWIPVGFRAERAVWRDAHSLMGKFENQSVRLPILDWLGMLTDEGLDEATHLALDVAGLCTDRAKLLSWHAEQLPLPFAILSQAALCVQIKRALEAAESGENALRRATRHLAGRLLVPQDRAGGEARAPDKKAVSHLTDSLLRLHHYWACLHGGFQVFLVDLAADGPSSIDRDTGMTPALGEWIRQCRHSACESMRMTCRAVGEGDRSYRAIAEAEREFWRALNQELPLPESGKEEIEHEASIAG